MSPGVRTSALYVQMVGMSFVQDLDRTKPLGVLITIEDDEPKGIGFLAVPDLDKALKAVREKFSAEVDDLGDGIQKLELGQGVYLKQRGEWVYFSDHPRHLTNLPLDPVAMLAGLDKQYSVALRLFVQNIPQNLRDLGLFQLHAKIDADAKVGRAAGSGNRRSVLGAVAETASRNRPTRWSMNGPDHIGLGRG